MLVYLEKQKVWQTKLGGLLMHLQTITNQTRKTRLLPEILILKEFLVLAKLKKILKIPAYLDSWWWQQLMDQQSQVGLGRRCAWIRKIGDSEQWTNSCYMPPVMLADRLVLRWETLLWLKQAKWPTLLSAICTHLCPYFFTTLEELMVRTAVPNLGSRGNDCVARMPFS